jgi:excisionase family DNA binding protein
VKHSAKPNGSDHAISGNVGCSSNDRVPVPRLSLRPLEAAESLGISLRTINGWVKDGTIPFVRLGERNLRFVVADLQEWLRTRSTWPNQHHAGQNGEQRDIDGGRL